MSWDGKLQEKAWEEDENGLVLNHRGGETKRYVCSLVELEFRSSYLL